MGHLQSLRVALEERSRQVLDARVESKFATKAASFSTSLLAPAAPHSAITICAPGPVASATASSASQTFHFATPSPSITSGVGVHSVSGIGREGHVRLRGAVETAAD